VIKHGDRVSLFHNIGKEGKVVGMKSIKSTTWFTNGTGSKTWRILIEWNDGTRTVEKISDVMRLD